MRVIRRILLLCSVMSAAVGLFELRKINAIIAALRSGASTPEAAMRDLASADKTGMVAKVIEAQQGALRRPIDPSDAEEPLPSAASEQRGAPAAEHPAPVRGPVALSDTNSKRIVVKTKIKPGEKPPPKGGSAVLIDSQGNRFELVDSRSALEKLATTVAAPFQSGRIGLPVVSLGGSDLESRKRRAYALLLATVAGTCALVYLVRLRSRT